MGVCLSLSVCGCFSMFLCLIECRCLLFSMIELQIENISFSFSLCESVHVSDFCLSRGVFFSLCLSLWLPECCGMWIENWLSLDRGYLIKIDLPLWSPIFITELWSWDPKEEFKPWCFLTTDRKCPYFLYDVIMTSGGKNQKYMFKYSHIVYHFEANLMLIQNNNRTISRKSIFKPEIEKKGKNKHLKNFIITKSSFISFFLKSHHKFKFNH